MTEARLDRKSSAVQVATYEVVPLSPWLGMLEFVGGTRPLMDVLQGGLDPEPARVAFLDFIQVPPPPPPPPPPPHTPSLDVTLRRSESRNNLQHYVAHNGDATTLYHAAECPQAGLHMMQWERNLQRRHPATAVGFKVSQSQDLPKTRTVPVCFLIFTKTSRMLRDRGLPIAPATVGSLPGRASARGSHRSGNLARHLGALQQDCALSTVVLCGEGRHRPRGRS